MRIAVIIAILLILPSSQALELKYVSKVIDGDTITLDNGEKVRLIGIDTPERGECYYKEAKLRLTELVLNKNIELEKDITNRDKYKRLLRYIYIENNSINNILVEEGYAKAYYYPPDIKDYQIFKQSEKLAKKNSLGIWKDCVDDLDFWTRIEIFFLKLRN